MQKINRIFRHAKRIDVIEIWLNCAVRRQRVQSATRFVLPLIVIFAFCTFGKNQRVVWRFEWLTFLPALRRFPHTEHIAMIVAYTL